MTHLITKPDLDNSFYSLLPDPSTTENDTIYSSCGTQNDNSSPIFLQIDSYKLPYQLDYPLNFKQTPQYARLPQPPCRSFGEWLKNACQNHLNDTYIEYTLLDLLNLFNSVEEYTSSESRYIINGGAHDGISLDPLHSLFTKFGYPGIAIELSKQLYSKLKKNLPARNIIKLNVPLNPHTVYKLFIHYKVPFKPLILKMDIDGYDYTIIRSIFIHRLTNTRTQYQPALVLVEMNEKFPPPINFYTRYRPYYGYKGDHLYGTSITAWTHLLSFELGYVLLGIFDRNNLIYIRYDLARKFKLLYQFPHNSYDVWLHGYWNRPDRDKQFYYNTNVQHWNDPSKTLLMKYRDIQNYLHSTKTFLDNIECSYFMDVQSLYIEPE
jgi:hypothetical protein